MGMSRASDYLQQLAMLISDQGNAALSKGIQWTGLVSVGTGGGLSIAKQHHVIESQAMLTLADWGIVISIIGGVTFIVKNIADIYFAYRKAKRDSL